MKLWSDSFREGGCIPGDNAFAVIDPVHHVRLSGNRNPHLGWSEVPSGTESLALFCFDVDVPLDAGDANREDRLLSEHLPRGEFFHWSLLDIPPTLGAIPEGSFADGVIARGKAARLSDGALPTMRQGLNDYTRHFAGDAAMAGDYYGYDGPCPPWNDERIHHYIFRLYALDAPRLQMPERFTGQQARAALRGHILDEAQLIGAYSLYPALAFTLKK